MELKKTKNYSARSATNLTLVTRLFSALLTVFILILTVKSELLKYDLISLQLVLAIPITFISMVVSARIHDKESFERYKILNLVIASVSISLVLNSLGLLITKYVSMYAGLLFFMILVLAYTSFFIIDSKFRKVYHELIILSMITLLGLLPSILMSLEII